MWKKFTGALIFIGACIVALFLREKSKREDAESKNETAEFDASKLVLQVKLEQLDKEQKAAIAIAEVEKNRKLTDKELAEYLDKV